MSSAFRLLIISDNLKQVPDQLESLIGDKHFLRAALLLVRSRKTINRPELAEMGALADLKAYLVSQETVSPALLHVTYVQTLADILVEELHSHIYLKTFYSDSRWRPYFPGQQSRRCFLPSRGVDIQCLWICNPKMLRLHTHQLLRPPPRRPLRPRRQQCPVEIRFLHLVPDRPLVSSASYPHWPSSQAMIRCSTTSRRTSPPTQQPSHTDTWAPTPWVKPHRATPCHHS